jgi:hypothetical protein
LPPSSPTLLHHPLSISHRTCIATTTMRKGQPYGKPKNDHEAGSSVGEED